MASFVVHLTPSEMNEAIRKYTLDHLQSHIRNTIDPHGPISLVRDGKGGYNAS